MNKPLRNVAASVRQRLLQLTHSSGQPNGELLDRCCFERLLYRKPHFEDMTLARDCAHFIFPLTFLTMTSTRTGAEVISSIFETFGAQGHRAYGERVTELQHGLQCATLARDGGEADTMVAACLLHDYGHLVHDLGEDAAARGVDARHEQVGANRLIDWFPPEVVEPIRLHAAAKRYLCWKEPSYYEALTDASRRSLALQGGVMTDAEAHEFEGHPFFDAAIRLRRYDDRGKDPQMITPGLEAFRGILESLIRG